jgi:hypothetical protein
MKRLGLVLCALGALATPVMALDTPTSVAPAANLSKPYIATLGDMIAFTMSQQMAVVKVMDPRIVAPTTFTYDHTSQKIVVSVYRDPHASNIFGDSPPGSVDQAKSALEYFRARVFPALATIMTNTYNVTLSESDLTLVYLDRTANMKKVLRREGSKYLVSSE